MPFGITLIAVGVRMDGNGIFIYQLFRGQINARVLKQAGNKGSFRGPVTPVVENTFLFRIGFLQNGCKATIELFVYLIHLLRTEQISPDQEPENFKKLDLLFGQAIVFLRHDISSADLNQKFGVSRLGQAFCTAEFCCKLSNTRRYYSPKCFRHNPLCLTFPGIERIVPHFVNKSAFTAS